MKRIQLSLVLIIFLARSNYQAPPIIDTSTDCLDTFLRSQNCSCSIAQPPNGRNGVETMTCNGNYLTNATQNTLPGLNTANLPLTVQIKNTYTMFPTIPASYINLLNFDLSSNQITSIGDLTNLPNVFTFYMNRNLLTSIPSSICSLTKVQNMDFSYNLIQIVYFESFVCNSETSALNTSTNYVFSSLQMLGLNGNMIRQIYRADLIFVGMPLLYYLDMSNNSLTQINVTNLSTNSINIITKANAMITSQNYPAYYDSFINTQSAFTYNLNFSSNMLTTVKFDFSDIYQLFIQVIPSESIYMLKKLSSISLNPGNPVQCDCGIYSDYNFVLNGAFNRSYLPTSLNTSQISRTYCNFVNASFNLYKQIQSNNISLYQICPSISSASSKLFMDKIFIYFLMKISFLFYFFDKVLIFLD